MTFWHGGGCTPRANFFLTFFILGVDKRASVCYTVCMMIENESIFEVTFTNDSTVFIKATDKAHARRIVERNGTTWTRGDDKVKMIIKKIEKV